MRVMIVIVVACLSSGSLSFDANEAGSDLISRLASPDVAVRIDAVRSLRPESIGYLEPGVAVRAVLLAMRDSNSRIRMEALGGLGLIAAVAAADKTNPKAAAFATSMHSSPELRLMLDRTVSEDPSIDVAVAASLPFMALYGSDPAAEKTLLDRADKEPDPVNRVKLMSNLEGGGIDGRETSSRLKRYLDDAPTIVQHKAAELLLSGERLPKEKFESFMKIIESPETFADPKIVRALPRFGISPEAYLPRLLALQARLEDELPKQPGERTVTIYNDAYWKETLEQAIAEARTSIQRKRS